MTSTVHAGREIFWVCLRAQCAPGVRQPIPADAVPATADFAGSPAYQTAAALLYALVDPYVSLAGAAGAVTLAKDIARRTGAAPVEPHQADFVITDADPATLLPTLRRGTTTAPETGATLVVVEHGVTTPVTLTGPGLATAVRTTLTLSRAALTARNAAAGRPPLGVDVFLASAEGVVALPRSTTVEMG